MATFPFSQCWFGRRLFGLRHRGRNVEHVLRHGNCAAGSAGLGGILDQEDRLRIPRLGPVCAEPLPPATPRDDKDGQSPDDQQDAGDLDQQLDQARAKRNVEDTITAHPEVTCFIGFYSYNTPRIYEAVKEAGQLGKIKIVGFDEDPVTLGGVKEGSIIGTVVQQPYEWGYQGMKLMAKYVGGDKSVIPADPIIIIPTKIIDSTNVDSFWAELKQRTGAK